MAKKVYLKNPSDFLYGIDEETVSNLPNHLRDLIDFGLDLEDRNSGDLEDSFGHMIYQFQSDTFAFVRRGLIGSKIKFYRLYKKLDYKRFNNFATDVFGKSAWQINREINAARVVFALLSAGFDILPTCTAQAEVIRNFGMEELIENWQKVIETIPAHQITANAIRELLFAPTEKDRVMKNVKIPAIDFDKIWNEARERCCSTPQFIAHCVDFTIANETESTKSQANRSLHSSGGFFLANIFSAFLHHFETLLFTGNQPLREVIWSEDLADLTSNSGYC
ncbi:MAG: hypothetical protein QNJ54_34370 [Prochloraceae cyanobacterium]|nr:hypothetical protein [Prochloraceae cyanobacterium]